MRQSAPGLGVLALSKTLSQENLKPLFHLAGGFVSEGHRKDFCWIDTVLTDQMSDPMG